MFKDPQFWGKLLGNLGTALLTIAVFSVAAVGVGTGLIIFTATIGALTSRFGGYAAAAIALFVIVVFSTFVYTVDKERQRQRQEARAREEQSLNVLRARRLKEKYEELIDHCREDVS